MLGGSGVKYNYLSKNENGDNLGFNDSDDGSGHQRWVITKGTGEWYTIKPFGGANFLSTSPNGQWVGLWTEDDGSGRQRWIVTEHNGYGEKYNIRVHSGVDNFTGDCEPKYLGASDTDVTTLELLCENFPPYLRRWKIPGFRL